MGTTNKTERGQKQRFVGEGLGRATPGRTDAWVKETIDFKDQGTTAASGEAAINQRTKDSHHKFGKRGVTKPEEAMRG